MEKKEEGTNDVAFLIKITKDQIKDFVNDFQALIIQNIEDEDEDNNDIIHKIFKGSVCCSSSPQSSKKGSISFEEIDDSHARICYFDINNYNTKKMICCNDISPNLYNRHIIKFIQCINQLTKFILNEDNEKIRRVIFTQLLSDSSKWNMCEKDIEKFAQKLKEKNIYVYFVSETPRQEKESRLI